MSTPLVSTLINNQCLRDMLTSYAAGGAYGFTKLKEITTEELHYSMKTNFEPNFCKASRNNM
jgi:hypothetical protein